MPILFKSKLSSAIANATWVDKTQDDATVGKLALENVEVESGNSISNTQGYINEIATSTGIDFFGDPNGNVYSSNNFITDGDSRKTAIGKLDAQAKVNQDATALNQSEIQAIEDSVGAANGICPLDSNSEVPLANLPQEVQDGLKPQGNWNADTNVPDLQVATPNTGDYWIVNVAGATDLDGITDWGVNDWAVYTTGGWAKMDFSNSVTSVNTKTGVVVLDKTDIGLTNVTDDAQLKRAAGDLNTFTEKITPVVDDIVIIEDSEDSFNKKKVKLENMLGSGGGGGGSFVWEENGNNSPYKSTLKGVSLFDFDDSSTNEIYALVVIPESYSDGDQITLFDSKFFINAASNNVLFRCDTSLLKDNDDITGVLNSHTSTNSELIINTLNAVRDNGDIDLTDGSGEINSVAVTVGDTLIIRLYRDNANETVSAVGDARFIKFSASINFGG